MKGIQSKWRYASKKLGKVVAPLLPIFGFLLIEENYFFFLAFGLAFAFGFDVALGFALAFGLAFAFGAALSFGLAFGLAFTFGVAFGFGLALGLAFAFGVAFGFVGIFIHPFRSAVAGIMSA